MRAMEGGNEVDEGSSLAQDDREGNLAYMLRMTFVPRKIDCAKEDEYLLPLSAEGTLF